MYYIVSGVIIMNYDEIAEKVGNDMINYNVSDESFIEVYDICLKKQGNFTSRENNKILTRVIHVITVLGYDIDSISPCKFKRFK